MSLWLEFNGQIIKNHSEEYLGVSEFAPIDNNDDTRASKRVEISESQAFEFVLKLCSD